MHRLTAGAVVPEHGEIQMKRVSRPRQVAKAVLLVFLYAGCLLYCLGMPTAYAADVPVPVRGFELAPAGDVLLWLDTRGVSLPEADSEWQVRSPSEHGSGSAIPDAEGGTFVTVLVDGFRDYPLHAAFDQRLQEFVGRLLARLADEHQIALLFTGDEGDQIALSDYGQDAFALQSALESRFSASMMVSEGAFQPLRSAVHRVTELPGRHLIIYVAGGSTFSARRRLLEEFLEGSGMPPIVMVPFVRKQGRESSRMSRIAESTGGTMVRTYSLDGSPIPDPHLPTVVDSIADATEQIFARHSAVSIPLQRFAPPRVEQWTLEGRTADARLFTGTRKVYLGEDLLREAAVRMIADLWQRSDALFGTLGAVPLSLGRINAMDQAGHFQGALDEWQVRWDEWFGRPGGDLLNMRQRLSSAVQVLSPDQAGHRELSRQAREMLAAIEDSESAMHWREFAIRTQLALQESSSAVAEMARTEGGSWLENPLNRPLRATQFVVDPLLPVTITRGLLAYSQLSGRWSEQTTDARVAARETGSDVQRFEALPYPDSVVLADIRMVHARSLGRAGDFDRAAAVAWQGLEQKRQEGAMVADHAGWWQEAAVLQARRSNPDLAQTGMLADQAWRLDEQVLNDLEGPVVTRAQVFSSIAVEIARRRDAGEMQRLASHIAGLDGNAVRDALLVSSPTALRLVLALEAHAKSGSVAEGEALLWMGKAAADERAWGDVLMEQKPLAYLTLLSRALNQVSVDEPDLFIHLAAAWEARYAAASSEQQAQFVANTDPDRLVVPVWLRYRRDGQLDDLGGALLKTAWQEETNRAASLRLLLRQSDGGAALMLAAMAMGGRMDYPAAALRDVLVVLNRRFPRQFASLPDQSESRRSAWRALEWAASGGYEQEELVRSYFTLYDAVLHSDTPMEDMLAQHQTAGRNEAGARLMTLWAEMIRGSDDLRRVQVESMDRILTALELEDGIAEDRRYILARMDALRLLGEFRSAAEWVRPLINESMEFLNQSDRVERMGVVLLAAGDAQHALSLFDRALSSNRNVIRQIGSVGRAIALAQSGDPEASVAQFAQLPERVDWPAPYLGWMAHAWIHALTREGFQEKAIDVSTRYGVEWNSVRSLMWSADLTLAEVAGIQ
jgi:tetratricopeptide (TPR) repeat protein